LPVLMKELQNLPHFSTFLSYRIVTESLGIIRGITHRFPEGPMSSALPAVLPSSMSRSDVEEGLCKNILQMIFIFRFSFITKVKFETYAPI
jgi:hypothetical protein